MDCPNLERCGGELTFRVYRDSDGDDDLPWTVRSWLAAELIEQTCDCQFTGEQMAALEKQAIEDGF